MALDLRLNLKLSQQLVMTPQLQQAIKLLQLSRMELLDMISQELEENPVLEDNPLEQAEEKEEVKEEAPAEETLSSIENTTEAGDAKEVHQDEQIDWQTYLEGYSMGGGTFEALEESEERPSYENLLTKKSTLYDHLMWQLNLAHLDDTQRRIAGEIIGNLDDAGYLQATLEEISDLVQVNVEAAEGVLEVVQSFDPVGVACRNLQECLLLQLRSLGLEGELPWLMLEQHLSEIESRKYNVIARALKVSLDDVLAAAKIISGLEPRPGRPFSQEDIHYITPDIFVHKIGDEYVVTLNDEGLPNLKINAFYRSALQEGAKIDKSAGDYIQDKMRSAVWLIKSIHQRQRTIYKVTKSIVKFQKDFFEKGIDHLKPLVLRDVAEDIEMHESTVSRVTTNKYVQTPRGLFELKYFFNSGISVTGGESVASESVKSRIKEIIGGENPKKPYSDQKIVEILKQSDINIARRTVTKYREMLGLGSSTERKRLF